MAEGLVKLSEDVGLRGVSSITPCYLEFIQGIMMAVEVSEVEKLREYVRGVLGAAQHHAGNVDEIILAITGAIIARKDDTPLQVRPGRTQEMGKAISFTSNRGNTYALSYNHATQQVDLKKNNSRGIVLHSFDNTTPLSIVASTFAAL